MTVKIRNVKDSICLSIVHSVSKQTTVYQKLSGGEEFPEQKEVLVKQIHVKKWFRKDGITSVEEYVTVRNKVAKNRSIVFDKYSGRFYATFHSAEEIMEVIHGQPPTNKIGFNHDIKVHPSGAQIQQSKSRRSD